MGNKIKGGIRARGTSEFKDIKTARLEVSADVLDQVISNKGFKSLHEKFNLRAP